jgi:hypothetical protein
MIPFKVEYYADYHQKTSDLIISLGVSTVINIETYALLCNLARNEADKV